MNPELSALATIVICLVIAGVIGVNRWMQAREKKLRLDIHRAFTVEADEVAPVKSSAGRTKKALDPLKA